MPDKKAYLTLFGLVIFVLFVLGLAFLSTKTFYLNLIGLGILFLVFWLVFGITLSIPFRLGKLGFAISIPVSIVLIVVGLLLRVLNLG